MTNGRWLRVACGTLAILLAASATVWVVVPRQCESSQAGVGQRAYTLSAGGAQLGLTQAIRADDGVAPGNQVVVVLPEKVDLSPPLRDVPPIVSERGDEVLLRWNETALPGRGFGGSSGVDVGLQELSGLEAMPTPIANFAGTGNVYGYVPPDTQGDVGPSHYVQWVNVSLSIYDKTGTRLVGPTDGNTLWSGFGGQCESLNDGDPITLYDHVADRWFMSQFALGTTSYQCIAVSQTPDPTGAWYRYAYAWPNRLVNDYPHFGLWPDGYYLTVNQFGRRGSQYVWRGAGVAAFERDKMLLGQSAQMVYFNLYSIDDGYGGQLPADMDGSTQPPTGAPGLILEWDDSSWGLGPTDALRVWKFHVDWATPANSYLGTGVPGYAGGPNWTIDTNDVDPTICGSSYCIDQPGTTVNLDQISDRLMHRMQYRNFGAYQALVGNHTVDKNNPAGYAGIHWFELRNAGTDWTMYQQGTYGLTDSVHRWMGSIAMDNGGNIALGYSVSSSTIYPSIRYVGRLASDPLGTMGQNETTLVAGSGYQSSSYSRWGDYSAMQLDPNDCTFWYTQEYVVTSGSANWVTRVGSFSFGSEYCTPTSVDLKRLEAWPEGNAIHVQWETAQEIDNLGFNLYRSNTRTGPKLKLNAELIPTLVPPGSPFGAVYDWVDAYRLRPGRTYFYWLEDVDLYGGTSMHGPVRVRLP